MRASLISQICVFWRFSGVQASTQCNLNSEIVGIHAWCLIFWMVLNLGCHVNICVASKFNFRNRSDDQTKMDTCFSQHPDTAFRFIDRKVKWCLRLMEAELAFIVALPSEVIVHTERYLRFFNFQHFISRVISCCGLDQLLGFGQFWPDAF